MDCVDCGLLAFCAKDCAGELRLVRSWHLYFCKVQPGQRGGQTAVLWYWYMMENRYIGSSVPFLTHNAWNFVRALSMSSLPVCRKSVANKEIDITCMTRSRYVPLCEWARGSLCAIRALGEIKAFVSYEAGGSIRGFLAHGSWDGHGKRLLERRMPWLQPSAHVKLVSLGFSYRMCINSKT